MDKEKFISVKRGVRQKLLDDFGCSNASLCYALNFEQNSLRAREIRSKAINVYGGIPFLSF